MSCGFRVHKWQVKHVQQFRNTSRVMRPGSEPQRDAVACRLLTSSRSSSTYTSSRGCSSDLLTLKFAYAMFICAHSVDHTPEWQNRLTSTHRNPWNPVRCASNRLISKNSASPSHRVFNGFCIVLRTGNDISRYWFLYPRRDVLTASCGLNL